ncbi:MAG: DUF2213 domain-containing protein [Thaumarchaeota archaeon]|nr:DUF2213 domain-containing protein [Nitrososphaerota archaeon]
MSTHATAYTVHKIGPNRALTPEGFLLCKDVPVARTGMMIYGPEEIKDDEGNNLEPGRTDIIKVYREDDDIFNDTTIASALGKSFTISHPDEDVMPSNWKELSHGTAINVRRGEGAMDDLLLMDLLITTEDGIKAVNEDGIREISLGYDAEYSQIAEGEWRQSNIFINHIAGVEQGRCGSRCAIKDHKTIDEETKMAVTNRYGNRARAGKNKKGLSKVMDLLFKAHKAKDAEELKEVFDEAADLEDEEAGKTEDEFGEGEGEGDTHIHIHKDAEEGRTEDEGGDEERWAQNEAEHTEFNRRLDALEAMIKGKEAGASDEDGEETMDDGEELEEFLEDEAPDGIPARDARKARDSRYLGESMKDSIAMAEILSPGIRMPTYDQKAAPKATAAAICKLRRHALDQAYNAPGGKAIFTDIIGSKKLDTSRMTCDAVRTMFRTAAALKRQANNSMGTRDSIKHLQPVKSKLQTIEEINAANAAYYSGKK